MNAAMAGQLDALALLEPDPTAAGPTPATIAALAGPCQGCGVDSTNPLWFEINHTIMPRDTQRTGFPVCVSMNLTYNHIVYAMGQVVAKEPSTCCYGKQSLHGRTVNKPTREQLLDHVHAYYNYAKGPWRLRLEELASEVLGLALIRGVPFAEVFPGELADDLDKHP